MGPKGRNIPDEIRITLGRLNALVQELPPHVKIDYRILDMSTYGSEPRKLIDVEIYEVVKL